MKRVRLPVFMIPGKKHMFRFRIFIVCMIFPKIIKYELKSAFISINKINHIVYLLLKQKIGLVYFFIIQLKLLRIYSGSN